MVKRVVLGRSGEEKVVDLLKDIQRRASEANTSPSGNKVLEGDEDFYWSRLDGSEHSMREIDEGLELAQGRIEEAAESLAQSQIRLDAAEQTVQSVESGLQTLENVTLPQAVADLEAADLAAKEALDELGGKLENIDISGELTPIREALEAAQQVADAASQVATEANTAANAASQAALEAAGIAASKGRVIVSETEPQGEDRISSNIWIQPVPDDPDTEIEEKAVTYVYLEATDQWQPTTSSELAQAAQNALDAREAAQQAQQRADTAVANASAAQAAAQAAQQTADQATLDARNAHNAAVEAAGTAEGIRADMAAGESVWADPSFERGWGGLPNLNPWAGRIDRSQEWSDSGEWSVKYTANGGDINNYGAYQYGPMIAEHWYLVTATVHAPAEEQQWNLTMDARTTADNSGEVIQYMVSGTDGRVTLASGETKSETWIFQAPAGTRGYRFWAGQTRDYNKPEHAGQVIYLDSFRMVDVTSSYPQYLAAKGAADAAQARADEAYAEAASKLDESEIDAKIVASANGKNSITRSLSAPSADGVVHGDQWYQVDGDGDAFASWYWGASGWTPSLIKNEMMESLDVHKLQVTGSAEMDEAVIDKLWVDGIAGKTATFNRLVVAGRELAPRMAEEAEPVWELSGTAEWGNNSYSSTGRALRMYPLSNNGSSTAGNALGPVTPVTPGAQYRFSTKIGRLGSSHATGGTLYIGFLQVNREGTPQGYGPYGVLGHTDSAYWDTVLEGDVTIPEGVHFVRPRVLLQGASGEASPNAHTTVYDLRISEKAGAVLIEDGAITTPKLTVTEDMSAAIVSAMSVNTKKLVVTEEAILNHATLIGQTVVDDINVQGKLIGKDGVFTGTVDFENVNVTGDLLAEKVSGKTLIGNSIIGAEITALESSGRSVYLAGDAVPWYSPVSPGAPDYYPGIRFAHENSAGNIGVIRSSPEAWTGTGVGALEMGIVGAKGEDTGAKVGVSDGSASLFGPTRFSGSTHVSGEIQATDWRASLKAGNSRLLVDGLPSQAQILLDTPGDITLQGKTVRLGPDLYDGNSPRLWLGAGNTFISSGGSRLDFESNRLYTTSPFVVGNGLRTTGNFTVEGTTNLQSNLRGSGSYVYFDSLPTSSSAGNMVIAHSNYRLYKGTSSRRYKKNIVNWSPDAERVLALQPRQWQHDDPKNDEIDERWHVGFVAEEVDNLGLKGLVAYVGDGRGGWRPEGLNYERFSAAQQVVLQKHEAEIKELRERIALLEAQNGTV